MPARSDTARRAAPIADPNSPELEHNRALVRSALSKIERWVGSRPDREARARARAARRPITVPASIVMPADRQWLRVADVVARAIQRGDKAAELHAAAALRIDSAEYEIGLLKHDLAAIMTSQRGANR